jgi:hypothetical protein
MEVTTWVKRRQRVLQAVGHFGRGEVSLEIHFFGGASLLGLEAQFFEVHRNLDLIAQRPDQAATALQSLYELIDENRLAVF